MEHSILDDIGLVKSLLKRKFGHTTLAVDHLFDPIMKDFQRLIEQELPEKRNRWELPIITEGERDDGLIRYNKPGKIDDKWIISFRPRMVQLLQENGADISTYIDFLTNCSTLFERCRQRNEAILHTLDQELPGYNFFARYLESDLSVRNVLRLAWYLPGQTILAAPHCDRSLITLHLGDSHPGLMLENETQPYQVRPNNPLVFCGVRGALLTHEQLQPMMHHVIATTSGARWALIFFTRIEVDQPIEQIKAEIKRRVAAYKELSTTTE